MGGIKDKILSIVEKMDALRVESERLREGWPIIEKEVFSLLDTARIRPAFLLYKRTQESHAEYLRIDWVERKLVEVRIDDFVVTLELLDSYGNLIGGDNEDSNKGVEDVTGIASSF